MKVNYTLPGLLPEPALQLAVESGERPAEKFGAQLRRLRAPEHTDWRSLLRLNESPAGAAHIGPPPAPPGTGLREGASQRQWWRVMLDKHTRSLDSIHPEATNGSDATGHLALRRMLGLLSESQRLEDEVFARHFAEAVD